MQIVISLPLENIKHTGLRSVKFVSSKMCQVSVNVSCVSVCEQESETEMNLSAALLKVKCRHSCVLIKVKTVKISDTHAHHLHILFIMTGQTYTGSWKPQCLLMVK